MRRESVAQRRWGEEAFESEGANLERSSAEASRASDLGRHTFGAPGDQDLIANGSHMVQCGLSRLYHAGFPKLKIGE